MGTVAMGMKLWMWGCRCKAWWTGARDEEGDGDDEATGNFLGISFGEPEEEEEQPVVWASARDVE